MFTSRAVTIVGWLQSFFPFGWYHKSCKLFVFSGLFVVLITSQHSYATDCHTPDDAIGGGQLFLQAEGNSCFSSPQLDMDVSIHITGTIARVKLEQHFRNPGLDWVEGVYVFPLPEDAAVDHLRMRIGDRVIEAEIREKRQAKAIYRAAKQAGKKASLLSQQRPNMFTTSVANIGPKEIVTIFIEYQQKVRLDQGQFSLRFPMTLTPRYIPGTAQPGADPDADNGQPYNTGIVTDAAEISPPFGTRGSDHHPASISVVLKPGFPVADVNSLYHPVDKTRIDDQHYRVNLARSQHLSNADFVLEWTALSQSEPFASLFVEQVDNRYYAMVMLMPPHGNTPGTQAINKKTIPKDMVFVIDTSGSMAGESIRQAKQALIRAIEQLDSEDRFNIIEFNSTTHALFRRVQPANNEVKSHASSFVRGLEANNGTEIYPAIERALIVDGGADDGPESMSRTRQVIFITDGAVGNEEQLFNLIKNRLGNSRLFTVGIGSAPNSHFMAKAAEFGRGTFTYIALSSEVESRMDALFQKLQSPVLTDIKILNSDQYALEFYPRPISDLYKGEPLVISLKSDRQPTELTISGRSNGEQHWSETLIFDRQVSRAGVSALWARRKIDSLVNRYIGIKDPVSKDEMRLDITRLAIDHHLVSRFTSLVAVDKTPERSAQQSLKTHALKNNPPKGSKMRMPRGATPAQLQIITGLFCLFLAAAMAGFYKRYSRIRVPGNHA